MSTATCTPDVRSPSVGENQVGGEPSSVESRGEATGPGAEPRQATNRDAKGRFGPGNLGGPGNPFARQMAKFRAFIMNCNTEEHMLFAFNMMMQMIADGNVQALKLYFLYIIGKPTDAVDPDKLDVDEWEGYKATAGMMDEATALMKAPTSDLPLTMLRIGKAANTQLMRDFAVHNLEHPEEMEKAKAEAARKKQEELDKAIQRANEMAAAMPLTGGPPVLRAGEQPSIIGGNGAADPRGSQSLTPRLGAEQPSANGSDGHVSPSPNGGIGAAAEKEAAAAEAAALLGRLARAWPAA
jgi:hypothetical protein